MLFTYSRKEGNPVIHKEAIPKTSSIEANEDESYLLIATLNQPYKLTS